MTALLCIKIYQIFKQNGIKVNRYKTKGTFWNLLTCTFRNTLYIIKYLIIVLIFSSLYPGIAAAPGVVPGGPSTAANQAHHLNQFVQPHPGYSVAQQQQQQQQVLQQQAQMQR